MARLSGIQCALSQAAPSILLKLETKFRGELDDVLKQDEMLWFQQSREEWITSEDLNMKFYHASLVTRKRRNHIFMLQNDEGVWIQHSDTLKALVQNFYSNLFATEEGCDLSLALHGCFPIPCRATLETIHAHFFLR